MHGASVFLIAGIRKGTAGSQKKQRKEYPCFFHLKGEVIMTNISFDYFTAAEAGQYTFYRIPKALFTEKQFQALSCEAKVLYGMMLDRMGLSIRNQWFDSQGRAYIIFTVEDVMGVMGCQSQKAVRLMKELDTVDGIGLIEKKRIGLGRPNRIYVKNFMVHENGGADPQAGINSTGKKAEDHLRNTAVSERKGTASADMSETARYMGKPAPENTLKTVINYTGSEEKWRMFEETMPCSERSVEKDTGIQEENWWDMDTDACLESSGWQQGAGDVPDGMRMEAAGPEIKLSGNSGKPVMGVKVENVDNADKYIENQNTGCQAYLKTVSVGQGYMDKCTGSERAAWMPEPAASGIAGRKADSGMPFVDKTVEVMVRELLWQEEAGAECSWEQGAQPEAGQQFPEPKGMDCEKQDSVTSDTEMPETWNPKRNDTEYRNTGYSKTENSKKDINETDFSGSYQSYQFYQSSESGRQFPKACCRQNGCDPDASGNKGTENMEGKMDAYREAIRENIAYSCFHPQETEDVDELVELMVDAMMVPDRQTIRIAGTEKPASVVKSRFMKLVHSHIQYVMGCLQKHTGKIRNIKAYLLTALYNSPLTISNYYRAEVNHDFYGCGC